MQKINPFLWFNDQAEEAMNFYISIFKNSRVVNCLPLWRRRTWTGGKGHGGGV